jgi:hypothetical protein
MFYLITKKEMEELYNREKRPEDLTTPDKIALLTYTGEDILQELKFYLETGLITLEEFDVIRKEIESFINLVKNDLEGFPCYDCFIDSVSSIVEEFKTQYKAHKNQEEVSSGGAL